MPNSYTQLHIHYVFAVKNRHNLIAPKYNNELQRYITGIVKNRKCRLLSINNMPDHLHILLVINPIYPVAKLIQEIKAISSKFINEKKWFRGRFRWQKGYGAFSCSHSHMKNAIRYIENQQVHHKRNTFREEYIKLLEEYEVKYENEYLFEFYD